MILHLTQIKTSEILYSNIIKVQMTESIFEINRRSQLKSLKHTSQDQRK